MPFINMFEHMADSICLLIVLALVLALLAYVVDLLIDDNPDRRDPDYEEFKMSMLDKYKDNKFVQKEFKNPGRRKDDK